MADKIYFNDGREPHTLENGLYEAEIDESSRGVGFEGRATQRIRRTDWGYQWPDSKTPLDKHYRIVWVRRLEH